MVLNISPVKDASSLTWSWTWPFWYWLSSLFLGGTTIESKLLFQCNETILACVHLWGETNNDNYCQRILFILCVGSVSGESTCCSRLLCWDNQPCLLCYLFKPCSRALSNSFYTAGPGHATASGTKLHISGSKPCAFGPTVSSRKNKIERLKKEKKMGEEEREREKEEKRDCSSGRVQIEFHINVCKFPRSCWLRLEKLISWMQRQYWCHQAERRGAVRC